MSPLAVLLALLAAAAADGPATTPDAAPGAPPAPAAPAAPAAAPPVAAPVPPKVEVIEGDEEVELPLKKPGPDPDFDPLPLGTSLVFGPIRPTRPMVSLDAGWLKSGVRFGAGAGAGLDLLGRADTFALGVPGGGQTGVYLGLRWSSQEIDPLRLSGTFEVGEVFVAGRNASASYLTLRGEVAVGVELDGWRPYGRAVFAMLNSSVATGSSWASTTELGLGLERTLGDTVLAAEGGSFLQASTRTLAIWRVRVGHAF